jgi:hypothetical protein
MVRRQLHSQLQYQNWESYVWSLGVRRHRFRRLLRSSSENVPPVVCEKTRTPLTEAGRGWGSPKPIPSVPIAAALALFSGSERRFWLRPTHAKNHRGHRCRTQRPQPQPQPQLTVSANTTLCTTSIRFIGKGCLPLLSYRVHRLTFCESSTVALLSVLRQDSLFLQHNG